MRGGRVYTACSRSSAIRKRRKMGQAEGNIRVIFPSKGEMTTFSYADGVSIRTRRTNEEREGLSWPCWGGEGNGI